MEYLDSDDLSRKNWAAGRGNMIAGLKTKARKCSGRRCWAGALVDLGRIFARHAELRILASEEILPVLHFGLNLGHILQIYCSFCCFNCFNLSKRFWPATRSRTLACKWK